MKTDVCQCHSGVKKGLVDVEDKVRDIFDDLATKVHGKYFVLLVVLVVGGLGFQWKTYDKIGEIKTDIAVIQTRLDSMEKNAR